MGKNGQNSDGFGLRSVLSHSENIFSDENENCCLYRSMHPMETFIKGAPHVLQPKWRRRACSPRGYGTWAREYTNLTPDAPYPNKKAPYLIATLIVLFIMSGVNISCLRCSIVWVMLCSGALPVCKCGHCMGHNPLFLSAEFGGTGCLQPHAPRPLPTPPIQKRGRNTDHKGNAMLQSLFSKTPYKIYRWKRPPPFRSRGVNGTQGDLCRLFSTQQRPKCCFYQTTGSRQPHIAAAL